MSEPSLSFACNVMMESTGEITAVYFQVRKGKVKETREFENGLVFADYDRNGYLVGIELLGPCKTTVVDKVAGEENVATRRQMKKVLKTTGPRQIVV